ncbi:MAG: hypothetical protein ACLPX8_18165 [Bryobacteraceae bacterium]
MYVVKDLAQSCEEAMARMGGVDGAEAERDSDRRFLESLGIQP